MHKWSLCFQVCNAEDTKVWAVMGLTEAKKNMKDLRQISFYMAIQKEQINELFWLNIWVSYHEST